MPDEDEGETLTLTQASEIAETEPEPEPEPEDTRTERERFLDEAKEQGHDMYQANIAWALFHKAGLNATPAGRHSRGSHQRTTLPKTKRYTKVSQRRLKQAYAVAQLARDMAEDAA